MGRLFWKIFIWFWLALALLNLTVGLGVKIYFEQTRGVDDKAMRTQVEAIALAFEHSARPRAREILEQVNAESASPVFVVDKAGKDILGRPLPIFVHRALRSGEIKTRRIYQAVATTPSGELLSVLAPRRPPFHDRLSKAPIWLGLAITLVISTLVCYWLARYLSTPIRRLSFATRQLAQGKLDVRVGKLKRRDEIADLAQDFDVMADKIYALLSAQKQLLQDISHELRSPLARLQVALALARRNNNDRTTDYDRIGKDLDRLETLIGEVLTLSRLETVNYQKEQLNLSELASQIIDDCRLEAREKGCAIQAQLNTAVEMKGSPELMRRAMENVLRNAIKYSAPNTDIEINLKQEGDGAVLKVCDRGPGIPEESINTMFDAFVRIDPARQHKPGGYGLGLAIARKAITLHGGTISAENRHGGGLCIEISVPVT